MSSAKGVSIHVEDAMRDQFNHAKIQGTITACTYSEVREGLLLMHEAKKAPGQHERGSQNLLTPTWTTLGCGDPTRPSSSALHSSVLSCKYTLGCAVPAARNLWLVQPLNLASWTRAPR